MAKIHPISAYGAAVIAMLLAGIPSAAQVPIIQPEFSLTKISPLYFGPYTFPLPENNLGRIDTELRADLAFDYVHGHMGDRTIAPTFLLNLPLWTDRASVRVWGEFHEWYTDTPETHVFRRIQDKYPLQGNDSGNIFMSLDLQLLRERRYIPSVAFRTIFLFATGDKYECARHYDAPGYAFDLTVGKDFVFGGGASGAHSLRPSAGIGFVCWQIDRGDQNDALLLEAGLSYKYSWLGLSASYGQYTGRIGKGLPDSTEPEGDAPKTVSARLDVRFGMFAPFICFQYGLQDWPFTQLRAGLSLRLGNPLRKRGVQGPTRGGCPTTTSSESENEK